VRDLNPARAVHLYRRAELARDPGIAASHERAVVAEGELARSFRFNDGSFDPSDHVVVEQFFKNGVRGGEDLFEANLSGAQLIEAKLRRANLREADLSGATLLTATLVETDFSGANLTDCSIYGISAWGLKLEGATQLNLLITPPNEAAITVDNLEIAQFIYLLLNNQKIRQVIDTITSKVVLILGRFTDERKRVLDAIREELRKHDYIPVLFDFDKPTTKDLHETITTLARMSRFVIADITDAKSIPQELVSIVEQLPSLPVQPILQQGCEPWAMYDHIKRYPWVLELYRYTTLDEFLPRLREVVISPAEMKVMEIRKKS
jgi:Pentapeptide repeats (8 copies)